MILDENFYQIQGWMLNRLKLKGVALNVYAIIYGYSQDGESVFSGGRRYLAEFVGVTKPTIDNALNSLLESGYIIKIKKVVNGVTLYDYKVDLSILQVVKNFYQGSKEILPNNKIYNKKEENILKENFVDDEELEIDKHPIENIANAETDDLPLSEPGTPTIVEQDNDCVELYNYWNSKNIIKHNSMTEKITKSLRKLLSRYSKEEIKRFIDRYKQVLETSDYFFKYKWSLVEFCSRKGGAEEFSDTGGKWLNYQQWCKDNHKHPNSGGTPKRKLNLI